MEPKLRWLLLELQESTQKNTQKNPDIQKEQLEKAVTSMLV